jgi:osmotically-inducible protein OsmY
VTDEELARDVSDVLRRDPRLDSRAVAVSAAGGVVTLRGTVGSPWEKHEATRGARRARGVVSVDDQLEVRLLDRSRREDAELRGDVLQALVLDPRVPVSVDATVEDGVVTLTGTVAREHQLEDAEMIAGGVAGVAQVRNRLVLDRPGDRPSAADVAGAIRGAFLRNAALDADNIGVTTSKGTVRLSGTVRSWDELEAAVTAAREAPGVKHVDNQLVVGL